MSKSRATQKQHRRKAWSSDKGIQEHAKREKRRKKAAQVKKQQQWEMNTILEKNTG